VNGPAGEPRRPDAGPVLVVGTGLIGTSIALALRARGTQVWLSDRDDQALAVAIERGAGVLAPPDAQPRLAIVAVPPVAAPTVIIELLRSTVDATVSDVVSTKDRLQREVETFLPDPSIRARYVPGHPMAGREVSGPAAAREDLFQDRVWALTPTAVTDPARLQELIALVESLGAVAVVTTPEEHDRAVALTSHTPQVVASAVAAGLVRRHPRPRRHRPNRGARCRLRLESIVAARRPAHRLRPQGV